MQMSLEDRRTKFINDGNKKFNKKFNYSKIISTFKTCDDNVIIICPNPKHGEFLQTPYHHLKSKYGCPECGKIESSKTRTKSNDTYKSQLEKKFGKVFDYSKVNYKGEKKDVILTCKIHNCEFAINAGRLLNTCEFGCPECVSDNRKKLAKSLECFINESNTKHNNKFKDGFTNTNYINSMTPITFNCPHHGEMIMTPHQHLDSPTGCTKCSGKYVRTTEEFDTDLKNIFGEKIKRIDPYINQHTQMRMSCEKHGEFPHKKTGSDLLNGHQGCPKCQIEDSSEKRRWTVDEWIEKAEKNHPDKNDDYSNISLETVDSILKVNNIFCKIHQKSYNQGAGDHHSGHRCQECKNDKLSELNRLPYKELIQRCREVHKEENYEYDEKEPEDYKNGNSKIPVICREHGIWYPSAHNHEQGSKCPSCVNKTEQKLYKLLGEIYPMLKKQYKVDWCKHKSFLPFDFVLEEFKIIIELDGPQHFIQVMNWKSPEETRKGDLYKMKCANDNGFSVIRILQEDVYNDRYDWLGDLDANIKKIKEQVVQNIYLCKNNEYKYFCLFTVNDPSDAHSSACKRNEDGTGCTCKSSRPVASDEEDEEEKEEKEEKKPPRAEKSKEVAAKPAGGSGDLTKAELSKKTVPELREIAKNLVANLPSKMKKDELVKIILEKQLGK